MEEAAERGRHGARGAWVKETVPAGPEVRSASGSCTGAQQRNLALCSQLQEVFRSVLALLPRLPDTASGALQYVCSTLVSSKLSFLHAWNAHECSSLKTAVMLEPRL